MKKITFCFLLLSFITSIAWSQAGCSDDTNHLVYNITFQSTWNATDHSSIPDGAHWSDLIMIYHSTPNQFLEFGQNASLGIKNLAELGDNTELYNEVGAAGNAGTAGQITVIPFTTPNNATVTAEEQVVLCQDFRYMTILSMVAPSPDWFIAANSIEIISSTNGWVDYLELDVYAYDAGTDDGTNYDSPNSPNTPVGISLVSGFPINGNKIGTIIIDFETQVLSTPNFEATKGFKMSPNPSKGRVTITGDNISNLESIKVYNILGSLVKDNKINVIDNSLDLNLSSLNKGIYLVKLNTKNGETTTQKLIIE